MICCDLNACVNEPYGAQRKTVILVSEFLFRIRILFTPSTLLLVYRSVVFKIFFYLRIFNDKKSLEVIILLIIWFLKYFLYNFRLVFLFTTVVSLAPGVMLLNHSTTPRHSATDIEKTPKKVRWSESDLIEAQ